MVMTAKLKKVQKKTAQLVRFSLVNKNCLGSNTFRICNGYQEPLRSRIRWQRQAHPIADEHQE